MRGKGIYFAISALLGILSALLHFIFFIAIFILCLMFLHRYKVFSQPQKLLIVITFSLFCLVGIMTNMQNKTMLNGNEQYFTIRVLEWQTNGDLLQIIGKDQLSNELLVIRYRMKSFQEKGLIEAKMSYGLYCKIIGKLKTPQTARNPNSFNYQKYLYTKKIHWIVDANQSPLSGSTKATPSFLYYMEKIRTHGINEVKEKFPEPIASLAVALLFGERTVMDSDLLSAYQRIGIVHLLAISGLQVSFLTGVLYYLGLRLGVVRERMISVLLVFLPFYALITGATPSVVRAVVMMLVILLGMKLSRQRIMPLDALSLAFVLLMFFSPFLIFDVGFQLSFCASAALLISSVFLLKDKSPVPQLLLSSYIAQLATLPIILYYFYEFSLLSLLANVIFVPFFSVFLTPFLFFVFLLNPVCGFAFEPLVWATNQLIILINVLIKLFSAFPLHLVTLGRPNILFLFVYTIVILFIFYQLELSSKRMMQISSLIFLPIIVHFGVSVWWAPYGEVTFIDVGQGDAILIKLPKHQGNLLIDTGGLLSFSKEKWQESYSSFEVGADIVLPLLKSKGVTTIDKLILTHGDFDHVGGAEAIIEGLSVKEIILPKVESQSELELDLASLAALHAIPVTYVSSGDRFGVEEFVFEVISPQANGHVSDKNDSSIVIHAQMGGLSWLFTGDLEKEGERKLVETYPNMDIDVLKVGHHGSNTSTAEEMLTAFQPEIAVISSGVNNRYGHPHQEVISRLEERRIKIYRTDQNGAISYIFQGKQGTFSVAIP